MQSLEFRYGNITRESCQWDNNPFGDFRKPNEGNPQNIYPHLKRAWNREGVSVVTGFQRAFFHLLFSSERFCQGVVIRDINPQIIGAAHFNILLLRIAENMADYAHISNDPTILPEIKARITKSSIPEEFQEFYLTHFECLAASYYEGNREWRDSPHFQKVHYYKNQEQFEKLQSYAKAGNIITTLGDIGDLEFLTSHEVVVIDTSNISDSQVMNIRCNRESSPSTIIWSQVGPTARFWSMEYHPLSTEEKEKMDQLISFIDSCQRGLSSAQEIIFNGIGTLERSPLVYSKETFEALNQYVEKWVICLPVGYVSLYPSKAHISKLQQLNPTQMENIHTVPDIENHKDSLVALWNQLDLNTYVGFSKVPGWKESFFTLCSKMQDNRRFQNHFANFPLFQEFQQNVSAMASLEDSHSV